MLPTSTTPAPFTPPTTTTPLNLLQAPMTAPPMPAPMNEVENAKKLWDWFNASGLSAEQLDALANMKKNGKDIDALLGIEKPKSDLDKLTELMIETDRKIGVLADVMTKFISTTNQSSPSSSGAQVASNMANAKQ